MAGIRGGRSQTGNVDVPRPRVRLIAAGAAMLGLLLLLLPASAPADHPGLNLVPRSIQAPDPVAETQAAEPPLLPTPAADCGPGSRPETGIQGRVSRADHEAGLAAKGFTCNTEEIGAYTKPNQIGSVGGFKVERYTDEAGNDCAYYDSTLLYPTNALDLEGGVNVLDMSDPTHPKLTAQLTSPAMLSPHESLVLSQERGVLAAVLGNPGLNVGIVDVYDISADCRKPQLKSSSPVGVFGHESGMSPDGKTFYSASPASQTIVAVDISNLSAPVPVWFGNYDSHGLSISADGNRAYVAGTGSGLIILDTSEIQARKPNPQVPEIARLQWESMSIPQNAIPITIDNHPYLVEIDEFGAQSEVGAGRIIDIEDETAPRVISNLRLEVHQPENFPETADDPGVTGPQAPLQGYAGHYCNVPTRVDPTIVACSMIASGLRVFDIRDPAKPREIAYYNAPVTPRAIFEASNWAMSSPSFVPERNEIWYSDGYSGFRAVRLTNDAWPEARDETPPCGDRSYRPLRGTTEADDLLGGGAKDAIAGRGGDDRLRGRGNDDCLRGGRGSDRLDGGSGADRVQGGNGDDRLLPGSGGDNLSGAKGDDRVEGGAGKDRLRGGPDDDKLIGGKGRDRLQGNDGNDRLEGGPGKDVLACGKGRDLAIAGPGDRVLRSCERIK